MTAICPRGYDSARKYYYPFPTEQSMEYAMQVCKGQKPDWTGLRQPSPSYSYFIKPKITSSVNGFTRKHAEQWVNVCTGQPCPHLRSECRPTNRLLTPIGAIDTKVKTIREMSDREIDDLCRNYRPTYPDATELLKRMKRTGRQPAAQVVYKGETIGIRDLSGDLHVSQPSPPLDNIPIIKLHP